MLSVGSLFSGIGGIELGLERTGKFETKWFFENNPYASSILEKHWKGIKNYGDITQAKWEEIEPVDVLTGGFPCQPFSVAGKRKAEKDERAMWNYFLEAIRKVKPKWVLAENVPGLISINSGRAFRNILSSLAEAWYDAEWFTLRASDFGAPHRRERLFIIAYLGSEQTKQVQTRRNSIKSVLTSHSDFQRNENGKGIEGKQPKRVETRDVANVDKQYGNKIRSWQQNIKGRIITDDWGERIQRFKQESLQGEQGFSWCENIRRVEDFFGRQDIPEPLICRKDYGFSTYVDRIRCIGNAVVPQVAQFIGEAIIAEAEGLTQKDVEREK